MLRLDQITYRIGPRTLFDGASATVNPGHRVGFVGRNGARRLQFRSANWRALPPDSAFWAISFSS